MGSLAVNSGVIFLPALGALLLGFIPKAKAEIIKLITFAVTALTLALAIFGLWLAWIGPGFSTADGEVQQMQHVVNHPWISSFRIEYFLGVDGVSFPLILLTAFISLLSMGASWNIDKHVKAYCILFLLLETGMLGVFFSLDFFLFYVFWEVMLLPMYFLIGIWGGPRREYAAIKFFLYTLVGSVLMLIAILMLYFASDLSALTEARLDAAHVSESVKSMALEARAAREAGDTVSAIHTFNILALQQMGQSTALFSGELLWGQSLQWWAFLLLFIGFVIKVPSVPVHTWLPDAHVEAPTPISMILAGVLLKLGGYGIIRICYPICPEAGYSLAWFVCGLGVVSMVYGAFAALAQRDFKRLVAYSSVSHMGYVVLGLGVWSATFPYYDPNYWKMGMNGAMFQMIAHGISSAGMFFMVGVIYDRVHHRNLNEFGGLFEKMPIYSGLSMGIFFAGLGLPGLCGFIGEVLVTLSVWNFSKTLAVISAAVVVITAAYILWTIQRVYMGPEYKGPHPKALSRITLREFSIAAPLLAFAIWFGVYPQAVFTYMEPAVSQIAEDLSEWSSRNQIGKPETATSDPQFARK